MNQKNRYVKIPDDITEIKSGDSANKILIKDEPDKLTLTYFFKIEEN